MSELDPFDCSSSYDSGYEDHTSAFGSGPDGTSDDFEWSGEMDWEEDDYQEPIVEYVPLTPYEEYKAQRERDAEVYRTLMAQTSVKVTSIYSETFTPNRIGLAFAGTDDAEYRGAVARVAPAVRELEEIVSSHASTALHVYPEAPSFSVTGPRVGEVFEGIPNVRKSRIENAISFMTPEERAKFFGSLCPSDRSTLDPVDFAPVRRDVLVGDFTHQPVFDILGKIGYRHRVRIPYPPDDRGRVFFHFSKDPTKEGRSRKKKGVRVRELVCPMGCYLGRWSCDYKDTKSPVEGLPGRHVVTKHCNLCEWIHSGSIPSDVYKCDSGDWRAYKFCPSCYSPCNKGRCNYCLRNFNYGLGKRSFPDAGLIRNVLPAVDSGDPRLAIAPRGTYCYRTCARCRDNLPCAILGYLLINGSYFDYSGENVVFIKDRFFSSLSKLTRVCIPPSKPICPHKSIGGLWKEIEIDEDGLLFGFFPLPIGFGTERSELYPSPLPPPLKVRPLRVIAKTSPVKVPRRRPANEIVSETTAATGTGPIVTSVPRRQLLWYLIRYPPVIWFVRRFVAITLVITVIMLGVYMFWFYHLPRPPQH